jgi:hypothetical protein
MAEVELAERSLLPRVAGRRSPSIGFQLDAAYQQRGSEIKSPNSPAREPQPPTRLDEIARLIQDLRYGQMIRLSDAIWSSRPGGSPVAQENLPELLHRWSTSHLIESIRSLETQSLAMIEGRLQPKKMPGELLPID